MLLSRVCSGRDEVREATVWRKEVHFRLVIEKVIQRKGEIQAPSTKVKLKNAYKLHAVHVPNMVKHREEKGCSKKADHFTRIV